VRSFMAFAAIFPSVALPSLLYDLRSSTLWRCLLAALYVIFAILQVGSGGGLEEGGRGSRSLKVTAAQLALSAAGIYVGSGLLVGGVLGLSELVSASPLEVSILIVPAATALPESIVALLWELRGARACSKGPHGRDPVVRHRIPCDRHYCCAMEA
jgi:cation:H+ antiporter